MKRVGMNGFMALVEADVGSVPFLRSEDPGVSREHSLNFRSDNRHAVGNLTFDIHECLLDLNFALFECCEGILGQLLVQARF